MTTRSEDVLYASLTDIEAMDQLARLGIDPEIVPDEDLRPMVEWALAYYFDSGRKQAPSREMLMHVWGEVLEEHDVTLIDESLEIDTVDATIAQLKGLYVQKQWQDFIKQAASEIATAGPTEKVATLMQVTDRLFEVTARVQDRSNETTGPEGYLQSLADYDTRAAEEATTKGMTFGMPEIDNHTYGIHAGEMAVMAAGPKVGKSYFLAKVALHEWATVGRNVVLYSLENTNEMTLDRIVCMHLGIDPRAYQRGTADVDQIEWVRQFIHDEIPKMSGRLTVKNPGRGERTPERLLRNARLLDAESVIIDQMSHVEHPDPGRKARHELFNENAHDFADLIKGRQPLSMLLANQINRAGVEAGKKIGYHEMFHLAETAGIEREASWVFALHQSMDERVQRVAKFQVMAARREDTKNWRIGWDPEVRESRVLGEIDLEAA